MPHRLSKSRYTAGVQCHKLLWWKVHEPLAVELQPDKVLEDRFDQGRQVGALARDRFPGGVLIDLPHKAVNERVKLTRKLIDDGAPAIFEASFLADNTFVAVDVLTPQEGGYHLTEVKSSSSQKEEHLPDAAVQVHVLSRSGIHITGVDVMHLNKECHFPDLSNLFERTDVTQRCSRSSAKLAGKSTRSSRCSTARCPMCRSGGSATSRTSARSWPAAGPKIPITSCGSTTSAPRRAATSW